MRIFLSHSTIDKPFVHILAADLIDRNLPIWIDEFQIRLGQDIRREIERGVADSSCFILVLSAASVESRWVNDEVAMALDLERKSGRLEPGAIPLVFPILIGETELPPEIGERLCGDFRHSYIKPLAALISELQANGLAQAQSDTERDQAQLERQIIRPLPITVLPDSLHLDKNSLTRQISALRRESHLTSTITRKIVLRFFGDENYEVQCDRLFERIEQARMSSDSLERHAYQLLLDYILQVRDDLTAGITAIIANLKPRRRELGMEFRPVDNGFISYAAPKPSSELAWEDYSAADAVENFFALTRLEAALAADHVLGDMGSFGHFKYRSAPALFSSRNGPSQLFRVEARRLAQIVADDPALQLKSATLHPNRQAKNNWHAHYQIDVPRTKGSYTSATSKASPDDQTFARYVLPIMLYRNQTFPSAVGMPVFWRSDDVLLDFVNYPFPAGPFSEKPPPTKSRWRRHR